MNETLIIFVLFMLIGLLVLIKNYLSKAYVDFFWYCDFVPFLFAIFFLINNMQWVKALINIGLITQFVTLISLIVGFVFGLDIIDTKKLAARGKFYVFVEILIHILPVNLALLLTLNVQPEMKSLVYSFFILIAMFGFTLMFTPVKNNINLVHRVDIEIENGKYRFTLPYQKSLWIFYAFIVVLITYLLQLIIR